MMPKRIRMAPAMRHSLNCFSSEWKSFILTGRMIYNRPQIQKPILEKIQCLHRVFKILNTRTMITDRSKRCLNTGFIELLSFLVIKNSTLFILIISWEGKKYKKRPGSFLSGRFVGFI